MDLRSPAARLALLTFPAQLGCWFVAFVGSVGLGLAVSRDADVAQTVVPVLRGVFGLLALVAVTRRMARSSAGLPGGAAAILAGAVAAVLAATALAPGRALVGFAVLRPGLATGAVDAVLWLGATWLGMRWGHRSPPGLGPPDDQG